MFIGYFTERPYQDRSAEWYQRGDGLLDLELSNEVYNPEIGADLYNRYLDEKVYIETMGFDGVALNSHHSTPFCMGGGAMNLEAAILARITQKLKIVLIGNVLPIWDDPLWLVEELAAIDLISRGRLVSGWVRGTGRESVAHNAQSPYNWERYQEAHDFIIKAWTEPGPFKWEGRHFNYRYVNPWMRPYQKPHPQIWVPGVLSKSTVSWAAARRFPYVMLDSKLELTARTFEFYREEADKNDFEAGSHHLGYMFKVHVDESEEKAYEVGRKFIEGAGNLFLDGSRGNANPWAQNLPGINPRGNLLPTSEFFHIQQSRGLFSTPTALGDEDDLEAPATPEEHEARRKAIYDGLLENFSIIVGTPESVLPKIRHVLETVRAGNIIFWDGDGDMTHEDTMRGIRLMGEKVLPAVRQMGKELGLHSAFEVSPYTNQPVARVA
jgi:alkanesulfonate monooxygenase SsuD/methylene tetrahydromethanopterin reductase-like flavin-dependent oxidoreductase (luciferase family)